MPWYIQEIEHPYRLFNEELNDWAERPRDGTPYTDAQKESGAVLLPVGGSWRLVEGE